LFTKEFYRIVKERLAENGIVVIQSGSTNLNMLKYFSDIFKTLKAVFPFVLPYQAYVPSFVGPWGFNLASMAEISCFPERNSIHKKKLNGKLKFYSREVHDSLFVLPDYLKESLEKGKVVK
jgi:spermidine synthase